VRQLPVNALLLLASSGTIGCAIEEHCETSPGYDEGERFRFTILETWSSPQDSCGFFEVGDTFELTAAPWPPDGVLCPRAGALGPPPIGGDLGWECESLDKQLGLECTAPLVAGNACGERVGVSSEPGIRQSDTVLDGAFLDVWATDADCRECYESFTVRIDMLDRQ